MTTEVLATTNAPTAPRSSGSRGVGLVLGGVLLLAVIQAVTVVLPYVVNGLYRFPLVEVAGGGHDPKDLWPQGWSAGPAGLLALLSWQLLLLAGLAGGTWATARGLGARRSGDLRTARLAATTVVVCVAALGYVASPFGTALLAWQLD